MHVLFEFVCFEFCHTFEKLQDVANEIVECYSNTLSDRWNDFFLAGKNEKLVAEMARKVELSEKQKWELKYRQEEMRRNNPTAWFNVQASRADTAIEEKRRQRLRQKIITLSSLIQVIGLLLRRYGFSPKMLLFQPGL